MSVISLANLREKIILVVFFGVLIGVTIYSRQPQTVVNAQSAPPSCPTCAPSQAQTIYTPVIDLQDASFAEINLNCRSGAHVIDVVPTFYKDDGTAITGDTFQMSPAEMRFVDVQSLIPAQYRGGHHWGGMSLSYTGRRFEVWGQMTFHGTSDSGSINSFFAVENMPSSNVRNAVWRRSKNSTATIALGNNSDAQATVNLTFSSGDVEQVTVPAHGTEIITRKNSGNNRTSRDAESVTINSMGELGHVIPMGYVTSNNGDFGSSIRFADTENIAQPNLYSTNFRLKNTTPHITLKNTTSNPVTANPRFLPTTGEGSGVVELSPVTIPASGTVDLNLTPLVNAAKTRTDLNSVSVRIMNTGGNGSLVGSANFTSNTTGVDYDIPLRDSGLTRNSAGGYPVRLDGDYTTTLSITNASDQAGKFTMQINFDGGPYAMYPQELAPGQTATFDIRSIRDQQIPDSSGRLLPIGLTIGQIRWSIVSGVSTRLIGRSEIISRSGKVSSSYSCSVNCGNSYVWGSVTPLVTTVETGDSAQFYAWEYDEDSYGNPQSVYGVTADLWTANGSYIPNGLATGGDPGDLAIAATWSAPKWSEEVFDVCDLGSTPGSGYADLFVKPKISSFSKDYAAPAVSVTRTINGKGFVSPSNANTVTSDSSDVTISGVTYVDATHLTATFNVAANASAQTAHIRVTVNSIPSDPKDFKVRIPHHLSVLSNIQGTLPSGCTSPNLTPVLREVQVKVVDASNNPVGQVSTKENFTSGPTTNTCRADGLGPNPSPCGVSFMDDDGVFTDAITVNCNLVGGSCGYNLTDQWQWCPAGRTGSPFTLNTFTDVVHHNNVTVSIN